MIESTAKAKQVNLNTILLGLVMLVNSAMFAVGAWVANETVANGKQLSAANALASERAMIAKRLEDKVDALAKELTSQRDAITDIRFHLATLVPKKP